MLLQSWGGKIRILPAMPEKWKEASFDQLRTQGAFLVSAVRKNGETQWVKIKSLAGEPCVLKIPGWTKAIQADKGRQLTISAMPDNEFAVDLKINEEVLLVPENQTKITAVEPVVHSVETQNLYGLRKGKHLDKDQSWPVPEYVLEKK